MIKQSGAACVVLLLLCSFPLMAQKRGAAPKTIRFQGAPQYTQQELLAAAGLKPDSPLSAGEIRTRGKQLNDTGLFKEVKVAVDTRRTLVFTLTPNPLFPMHLDNVPLVPGKELDAELHKRFPLYRGLLPAGGSMVDGICHTFEEMLAARGAKVVVKAALTSDLGRQKLTAVNFTIVSPAVRIGRIQFSGVSPAMQAKAGLLANGQIGNSFDAENTAAGLQHVFKDLYEDQGYAAVQVDVAQADSFAPSDQSIDIPYTVTIKEGGIYKLGTINFPGDALVARADVEKIVAKEPTGAGRPLDLFVLAVCEAYHARGYLDCSTTPHPSFNEATHIVNYSIEVTPGSQYRLASVKFDGAPDAMAAKLKLAWKMSPGSVFDQTYLASFSAQAQKKDKALTKWLQTVITTSDIKTDPATHEVNCIFHFAKIAQNTR